MSNSKPTEEEIQSAIVRILAYYNIQCLQTSYRGVKCSICHKKVYGGYGASLGVPDLFVRHKVWPKGLWLGMEVKRPGGGWTYITKNVGGKSVIQRDAFGQKISAQKLLWEAGATARVESVDEALSAIFHTHTVRLKMTEALSFTNPAKIDIEKVFYGE
jgi:hypothetical protein